MAPQHTGTPSGIRFETLVTAEVAGCQITVDTVRWLPETQGGARTVYLLGFTGQTSVARAAWANLLPPYSGYLKADDELYTLACGGRGWERRTSRLSFGVEELVMFPPCADRWADISEMLVVDRRGSAPADTLMRFLEYRSSVPLDADWRQLIWDWAIEIGATVALDGLGPKAWLVRLSDALLLDSLKRFAGSA